MGLSTCFPPPVDLNHVLMSARERGLVFTFLCSSLILIFLIHNIVVECFGSISCIEY